MYIEFKLPNGRGGTVTAHYNRGIRTGIKRWLEANNITDYDIRAHVYNNYCLAFTLSDPQLYTLFLLAWNEPTLPLPRLVKDY